MQISQCIQKMTKLYLDRLINSFTKDINKFNEEQARNFISKNIRDIKQKNHVKSKLDFSSHTYCDRRLMHYILIFLLIQNNQETSESEFFNKFAAFFKLIIKQFKNKEVLVSINKQKINIIKTIYEVVNEDDNLSRDEEEILNALKKKLALTEVELNAIINTVENVDKIYNYSNVQYEGAIKELQNLGIVFYLNFNINEKKFVIPEEFVSFLAKEFNYPLDYKSYFSLLDDASRGALHKFAKTKKIQNLWTKEDIIKKLWNQGYSAREILESFDKTELIKIAGKDRKNKGIRVSVNKNLVVEDLLKYFFKLKTIDASNKNKKLSEVELWEYYEDIANRKYDSLRELGIIKKDLEVEYLFENLTRYAFNKICGLKLKNFSGNNKPDGGAYGDNKNQIMIWDNKSQETPYDFPSNHQKQFLQYIVQNKNTINSFLVVINEIENKNKVEKSCIQLSGEGGVNVGIITAKVLKELIDNLVKRNNKQLNIQVFNHTGILTKEILELRLNSNLK